MQYLKIYTREFNTEMPCDHRFIGHFISMIRAYNNTVQNHPIPRSPHDYIDWEPPTGDKVNNSYYNILYIFAKFTRVKLMWRNKVGAGGATVQPVIRVFGEILRVRIFESMINSWYLGQMRFTEWVKIHDRGMEKYKGQEFKTIRSYSSYLVKRQEDMIYTFLSKILENNHAEELKLESWIKQGFKLDYKNYNTDHPEYYHAISTKFHHKRMLL